MIATDVPEFLVYGEPSRPVELAFLHVETVSARKSVHSGSVKMHRHPHLGQITLWTRGSGVYRIEDTRLDFSVPTASFVPSGIVHGFEMEPGSDAIVVSLADDMLDALVDRTDLVLTEPVFVTGEAVDPAWRQLTQIVGEIEREYRERRAGAPRVLEALVAIALCDLRRLAEAAPALAASPAALLAAGFRRLVDANFRKSWQLADYAAALGTTPYLLGRASHAVLGTGVKDAILARRLLEAKRLLRFTVRSVEDIAYETGFKDVGYFSRFFSKRCGQAPSEWRRRPAEMAGPVAKPAPEDGGVRSSRLRP